MTFEERKRDAANYVSNFLSIYSTPRGLDHSQLATRIAAIAEAFARRMPTKGDYHEACERVLDSVRDSHLSNSWPSQAVFVMAMPQSEAMGPKAAETFRPDEWELHAQKMADGQPVPDRYVWGHTSEALVNKRLVTIECRDRYRKAVVKNFSKVHGNRTRDVMAKVYGPEVDMYFAEGAA